MLVLSSASLLPDDDPVDHLSWSAWPDPVYQAYCLTGSDRCPFANTTEVLLTDGSSFAQNRIMYAAAVVVNQDKTVWAHSL